MDQYIQLLSDKKVAMLVNQTSRVGDSHIVDSLLKHKVNIVKIFSPEHGFRGEADNGEEIDDSVDDRTGLPLVSLYGSKKKASAEDLAGIDIIVFDIQDVGVRFYTYISTLQYLLEAASENDIPVIVLDRPNPNIHYVDGPVLEEGFKSFVGMNSIPVVYGMTIGEYGIMINEEGWLSDDLKADLTVIPCTNYTRTMQYDLPVKPSPNLPNLNSILHYPSLCFFEPTTVSIGRGTTNPFEFIGHPELEGDHSFTPESRAGAKNPKHLGKECFGIDLRSLKARRDGLDLSWVLNYYSFCASRDLDFITNERFFNLLAGTDKLLADIRASKSEEEIRQSWQPDLDNFNRIRTKYLIYPD